MNHNSRVPGNIMAGDAEIWAGPWSDQNHVELLLSKSSYNIVELQFQIYVQ